MGYLVWMLSTETSSLVTESAIIRNGLNIAKSAEYLRNYIAVEKARLRILAGWFLRIGNYERKYKLAYHLYDCSEHVSWLLARLKEMRGGNPSASIRPQLKRLLDEALHAPTDNDFLMGFYGILTQALLSTLSADIEQLDPSGNANEVRLLQRIKHKLEEQMQWFDSLKLDQESSPWASHLKSLLNERGGIHNQTSENAKPSGFTGPRFERPQTIVFDDSIEVGELASYENRQQMDTRQATIEQFRVFFNEFYAAALLASILFDGVDGDYPWDFYADFSRHFWDEARHSEFGAIRLKELGVDPNRVNPVLFEESEGLPILHRVTYLTRGLEAYFMPRKPKRMVEYEENGDPRSQLFADQDWSDEINHVRYGSKWCDYLLEDDYRDIDDIIGEVKDHLTKVRGTKVDDISAPF
ncbi:MAG: DUF455 family protein [Opitutales bacterium]|nr:DUF455 family protein [Opitutales bacterium]